MQKRDKKFHPYLEDLLTPERKESYLDSLDYQIEENPDGSTTYFLPTLFPFVVAALYYTSKPEIVPFEGDHPRFMGIYMAEKAEDAYEQFLAEFAWDLASAQRFYPEVIVIPVTLELHRVFDLRDRYGHSYEFPDPEKCKERM